MFSYNLEGEVSIGFKIGDLKWLWMAKEMAVMLHYFLLFLTTAAPSS